MRVKAIAIGEYANAIMEVGQVFDLVPRTGLKQVHEYKDGKIISTKLVKHTIKPADQLSTWMKPVNVNVKKTVQLEKVGTELNVRQKTLKKDKVMQFSDGKHMNPGVAQDESEDLEDHLDEALDLDSSLGSDLDSDLEEPEITEENTRPPANESEQNVL